MSFYTESFSAGETKKFADVGRFFRLLTSTYPVDVRFFMNGAEVARADAIEAGYAEFFENGFDSFVITSATAQAIKAVARTDSNVKYDRSVGSVAITDPPRGTMTHLSFTIGTSSSAPFVGSPSVRKYLLIRNNGNTDIYFRFGSTAATTPTGNSFRLGPGDSWETAQSFVPTNTLHLISTAAGGSVLIMEGV